MLTLAGSRGATGGRASERVRSALVVSQVALTMVLLIGAGLLGRSLLRVLSVEPGFRTEGAVVMNVAVAPMPERQDVHRESSFLQALITRLSAIPGVREAGAVSVLPLAGGAGPNGTFLMLDHPEQTSSSQDVDALSRDPERVGDADFTIASEGYFRAMAIPLVRGRLFGPGDGPDAQHVAVISESLAATHWPGEDPIGKFIYYGNMDGIRVRSRLSASSAMSTSRASRPSRVLPSTVIAGSVSSTGTWPASRWFCMAQRMPFP